VIALTCNVPTAWLERRIQMRIDHHALFGPLTKASLPLRANNVGRSLGRALSLACAEPPGPVHLDLPEDVSLAAAAEAPELSRETSDLPDIGDQVAREVGAALARALS
jgi:acetolactate synthase-1/2/3 large subunit